MNETAEMNNELGQRFQFS